MAAQDSRLGMRDHLKRSARFFLMIVAIPFAFSFYLEFKGELGFVLILFAAPLFLIAFTIGWTVFSLRGLMLARAAANWRGRALATLAVPLMGLTTILLLAPASAAGARSGIWTRLMANVGHYEAIIARARSLPQDPSNSFAIQEHRGVEYIVDHGPPLRIAFNAEGLLNNWSAIVFDPTGKVVRARGLGCIDIQRIPKRGDV